MKEIPIKQWRAEEALRRGVTDSMISKRLKDGKYPDLKVRRVNSRVVFVQVP